MRIVPSRYLQGKPLAAKKVVSKIEHLSAPLKGLSLSSQLTQGDPLTGPVLDNWVVEEDKIRVRPGTKQLVQLGGAPPIDAILPYYGAPQALALATDDAIHTSNPADLRAIRDGFGSGDWHWSSFSNLGADEYTVMVNGVDGVWSWDGDDTVAAGPFAVTSISKANPAVVTVSTGVISNFLDGDTVTIDGITGSWEPLNGAWKINNVNAGAGTFDLVGSNSSGYTGTSPSGTITIRVGGSIQPEIVTAPAAEPWIVVAELDKILAHMNRLWFADSKNLAVYYLPVQQKSGELKVLPLNAVFRRGGHLVGMYTWTIDGGAGMDDQLVLFSSNGEAVIYSGTDPDTDFMLVGIFRFDSPMSKHSVINFGGDLYVLVSTGLVPMTTVIRAEAEKLGKADKNVFTAFWDEARAHRLEFGWGVVLEHHTSMAICNLPQGGGRYRQMVRFMPNPIWASWSGLPSRCWQWIDGKLYFATDDGRLFHVDQSYLADNGNPITADVQFAWSSYKTPAIKHWKLVLPYLITEGDPRPFIDMKVDYDMSLPTNQPEVSTGTVGALWDTATWDEDYWAQQPRARGQWQGVAKLGRVGAPRLRVSVVGCTFALAGMDVIYEPGSAFG